MCIEKYKKNWHWHFKEFTDDFIPISYNFGNSHTEHPFLVHFVHILNIDIKGFMFVYLLTSSYLFSNIAEAICLIKFPL